MKNLLTVLALGLLFVNLSHAAAAKSYQITGTVLSVSDTTLVVQKGNEKREISGDKTAFAEAKVGDKVTVYYTMVAKSVEIKAGATTETASTAKPATKTNTKPAAE
jgi:hypothetical protein